jgi:hypothetical protein
VAILPSIGGGNFFSETNVLDFVRAASELNIDNHYVVKIHLLIRVRLNKAKRSYSSFSLENSCGSVGVLSPMNSR